MRTIYTILVLILCSSCTGKKSAANPKIDKVIDREIVVPEFQTIIDSANVKGAILMYDLKDNTFYSNDFAWIKKGKLPASTFKITNSIIALELGIVENDSTIFKWNGERRRLKIWEQDLMLKEAFHFSCVPCYQEVARKIGPERMSKHLDKLVYGNINVDSTNIDMFWLEGTSRISQLQQIDFLKRFYQSELPISKRTELIMKRMMVIEDTNNYILRGKTGWSIRNGKNNGWFVGYVETQNNTYFFATNIVPKKEFNMSMFPLIRKKITMKALKTMKIIK
ncbi:class D beta-lactamase [Tenacibaculum amylolyticum]|uniref:class D beta-lactamase n=1 Tax=Tenacibaculum amylolyticum TaxID=104269 RepID=UPI0038939322